MGFSFIEVRMINGLFDFRFVSLGRLLVGVMWLWKYKQVFLLKVSNESCFSVNFTLIFVFVFHFMIVYIWFNFV